MKMCAYVTKRHLPLFFTALQNAKGAFVTSCFATTYQAENAADIPQNQRDYFIDDDG